MKDIRVSCNSDDMTVTFYTTEVEFNGLVYPKGLSKNSSCMTEYIKHGSAVTYVIPLRLCNTMSVDVDEGVEFFNTIVLQPHRYVHFYLVQNFTTKWQSPKIQQSCVFLYPRCAPLNGEV